MMKRTDDQVFVVSKTTFNEDETATTKLLGIFTDYSAATSSIDDRLWEAAAKTTSSMDLGINKTEYFRQFEHCSLCCNDAPVIDRLAYVIEVPHDTRFHQSKEPAEWHFYAMLPSRLEVQELVSRLTSENRVYVVCLPYRTQSFETDFIRAKNEAYLQEGRNRRFKEKRHDEKLNLIKEFHASIKEIKMLVRLAIILAVVYLGVIHR